MREERLQDREGRGHRHLVIDHFLDHRMRRVARRIRYADAEKAPRWTDVGLVLRIEILGRDEAVLQVVDPEVDRVPVRDGAQMAGHFDTEAVRFRDRGPEFGTPDVRVRLDPRRTLGHPVRDEAARRLG